MKHEEERFFKFCCKNIEHVTKNSDLLTETLMGIHLGHYEAIAALDDHVGDLRLEFRNNMRFKELVELYSERYNVSKHLLIYYIKKWRDKGLVCYFNYDDQMTDKDEELLLYGYFNFVRRGYYIKRHRIGYHLKFDNEYNNLMKYVNMIPQRIQSHNRILYMHVFLFENYFSI